MLLKLSVIIFRFYFNIYFKRNISLFIINKILDYNKILNNCKNKKIVNFISQL